MHTARPSEVSTEFTSFPRWVKLLCMISCELDYSWFFQVELFGVTANETSQESHELLEEILDLQKEIYSELGFHYKYE